MFIKNDAFVNGYGEPCEIIYMDINNIWHVLDPLISRLSVFACITSPQNTLGEGRDSPLGVETEDENGGRHLCLILPGDEGFTLFPRPLFCGSPARGSHVPLTRDNGIALLHDLCHASNSSVFVEGEATA